LNPDQYEVLPTVITGMSDHLPVRVDIQTQS
jgi:endonuclease/exonuclease/phosphatase family metal-dependent hydrolase